MNILPLDSLMSNLYTQLEYSTYEFTTVSQLAALTLFGATEIVLNNSSSVSLA